MKRDIRYPKDINQIHIGSSQFVMIIAFLGDTY